MDLGPRRVRRYADELVGLLDLISVSGSHPPLPLRRLSWIPPPESGDDDAAACEALSGAFDWYLRQYHGALFAQLGGLFLDGAETPPSEALNLFCWMVGYHRYEV